MNTVPESPKSQEGQGAASSSSSSKWRNCFVLLVLLILIFCVIPLGALSIDEDPVDESQYPFLPAPTTQDFPEKERVSALLFKMDQRHTDLEGADFFTLKYGDGDWSREAAAVAANEPDLMAVRALMGQVFKDDSKRTVKAGRPLVGQKSIWSLLGRHWNRHINRLERRGEEDQAFQETLALLVFSKQLRGLYSYEETEAGLQLTRSALKKAIHLSRGAQRTKSLERTLRALNRFEVTNREVKVWLSRDYRTERGRLRVFAKTPEVAAKEGFAGEANDGAGGLFGPWLFKENQTHQVLAKAYKNAFDFVDLRKSPFYLKPFEGCGFTEVDFFEQSPDWWLGGNGLGYELFLYEVPDHLRERLTQQQHSNGLLRFAQVYLALKVYKIREGQYPEKLEAITAILPDRFFSNQKPFEFAYERDVKLEILMEDGVYTDIGGGLMERRAKPIRISAASFQAAKRPRKKKR